MWDIFLWVMACLAALLVLLGLFITFAGLRHSKQHVVSRSIKLKQSQEAIWAVINDHANEPTWQPRLESSRQLPDENGQPVWIIRHQGPGNPPMKLTTTVSEPPCKLVRTIDDAKKVFTGRWEFKLTPEYGSTLVTITEYSEIANPFFRGMFHLFGGSAMYIQFYLEALAGKFGELATVLNE